ncbi:MAG: VCBS repeat-containing protein [Holophagales bacterium]|nr:MAG: VCBS repeat-containing protein [Holophagales bacterium]
MTTRRQGPSILDALASLRPWSLGVVAVAVLAVASPLGAAVATPVLKWVRGGCFTSWCQTGWYGSPAVADLDGDGTVEVIWASYDLVAVKGTDGTLVWRSASGQRSWPGVVVADLDGDGALEIAVGRGGNELAVVEADGALAWSRHPFAGGEVRTLAAADLDGDDRVELLVGRASSGSTQQVAVYSSGGDLRPGWPARRDGEPGYGAGMYNENLAVGDLDGDGRPEIYAPTDTHYVSVFDRDGNQRAADPATWPGKVWSQVGVHVDLAADLRGYAECGVEHRPNFANAAPAIGDLDRDGSLELVLPGDVYDCSIGDPDGDLHYLPWILRADRRRATVGGVDWTVLPTAEPGSGPLSQDYSVIENAVANAVLADLDGDGRREVLLPSYDGRLHVWWLDKSEHGLWPFAVPGSGIRFASEPAVADLDGDGQAEVIFASWPEKNTGRTGDLFVLSSSGQILQQVALPAPFGSATWNGALGAPTLADLDGDADLELVLGTASTGLVAYDLPGTANARRLWPTGRGSRLRDGNLPLALFRDGFETGAPLRWRRTP